MTRTYNVKVKYKGKVIDEYLDLSMYSKDHIEDISLGEAQEEISIEVEEINETKKGD